MITTAIDIKNSNFLQSFSHVIQDVYLDNCNKTKLDLFILNINANEFDYENFKNRLIDPIIEFSLSRKIKKQYKNSPGTLSHKAREKFKSGMNTGELGEFLLFCFLENHLKAPKILTKLELKTSSEMYVHGSDGIHFLKLENGDYQLIFGESKTIKNLTSAIARAFESIYLFKNGVNEKGKSKSGLVYERGLINDEIEKETFSKKERDFIKKIIYPQSDSIFGVDDAFAIFIGYEIKIAETDKGCSNSDFRKKIHGIIKKEVEDKFQYISEKIKEYNLLGHNFYIYVLPFTNLKETRQEIITGITQ